MRAVLYLRSALPNVIGIAEKATPDAAVVLRKLRRLVFMVGTIGKRGEGFKFDPWENPSQSPLQGERQYSQPPSLAGKVFPQLTPHASDYLSFSGVP
jgi:hypothetical protein